MSIHLIDDTRLKRLRYRAWHRGTKEADMLVGGFFDAHVVRFDEAGLAWFEAVIEEQDVDIMGWAFGTITAPAGLEGEYMEALRRLDYVEVAK